MNDKNEESTQSIQPHYWAESDKGPLDGLTEDCTNFQKNVAGMSPEEIFEKYKSLWDQLNAKLVIIRPEPDTAVARIIGDNLRMLRQAGMVLIPDEIEKLESGEGVYDKAAASQRKKIFNFNGSSTKRYKPGQGNAE